MTEIISFMPAEIIRKKRDGGVLTEAEIAFFVRGITSGDILSEQISALAMATYFQGMSMDERALLTLAMRDSGDVMDWTKLGFETGSPIVDKHSTGGVGDKISLMLAPIVAACDCFVPMISGRGLGHTGGTLDKLQSIPGYDPYPDNARFAAIVKKAGCSIIGQTGNLAPADKRFYGIRDVTGTVESIPLITASILSKKLAAGLSALVMDVKCGNGAFMTDLPQAQALAKSIVKVAGLAGCPTSALVTDMNTVLGTTAGNGLEVMEAIEFLINPEKADTRLKEATLRLASAMIHLAGKAHTPEDGLEKAVRALDSGQAAEIFQIMVAEHGGPGDLLTRYTHHLSTGPYSVDIPCLEDGVVTGHNARAIGMVVVGLGGGRLRSADPVDPSVGLSHIAIQGAKLSKGDPVARLFAKDKAAADQAIGAIQSAIHIFSGDKIDHTELDHSAPSSIILDTIS